MTTTSNTINYTDFNPSNLKFTKLEENDRSNGQLIAYPRYNRNGMEIPLEVQLPWIKLFTYGVPQLNQFYKTDSDRSHLRLPLDLTVPEIAEFAEKLRQIDSIMGSPEMMESLLGKKSKKYKYQPLYREGIVQEEDSDEEGDSKKKKSTALRPPYFKLKLKLSYPDKKIESKVFESEESPETGKRIRTKVDTTTIDEFANIVRYKALIRPVMKPFKLWAHPLTKKDPEFGIACRLERIEVDKASINGSYKSIYESENFIDSEDEELPKIHNLKVDQNVKTNDSDDSSDEDVTKPLSVKEKLVEVDSDLDDETNVSKLKMVAQVDTDDSDEDVVIQKPPPKKEGKKQAKSKK
jgi:hypothetical protein